MAPSPSPPAPAHAAQQDANWQASVPRSLLYPAGLERVRLYHWYCDLYRTRPDPSCVVAFRFPVSVSTHGELHAHHSRHDTCNAHETLSSRRC